MSDEVAYERIGRFIYSAYRHGATIGAVYNWMADDLNVARPDADDESAGHALYTQFFARYNTDDAFQANHQRFVASLGNA